MMEEHVILSERPEDQIKAIEWHVSRRKYWIIKADELQMH